MLIIAGCGAKPKSIEPSQYYKTGVSELRMMPGFVREGKKMHARGGEIAYMIDGVETDDPLSGPGSEFRASEERLVISNAYLSLESAHPDTVHERLAELAVKYRGYIVNSSETATTLRIPITGYHDLIAEIEKLGKVKDKNLTGQDVTEDYRDLEIWLDSAEKSRQRYLSLLDKAEKVEEILSIEREIERLNREIEQYKGKLQRMAHLVQYATITVNTIDEIKPGPFGYLVYGLYKGVEWLFVWK